MTEALKERIAGGKFVTFRLAGEEYGLGILKVQEIMGMMDVTPVPQAPPHVLGVINLRGKIIPVVDLRLRFEMPAAERTPETCIIVVEANGRQTGIVVDRVSEVLRITGENIENAPDFGEGVDAEFVPGIGKCGQRVVLLLDIDKVLASLGPEGGRQ